MLERVTKGLILAVYVALLTHPINLTAGDLGRHLKNGELFIQNGLLAKVNLYSYAQPDYPFINHHWGTGVVLYLIEQFAGFSGLSLAFIAISVATLWLLLNLATKLSSFPIAALLAVLCMPILITRHEIRPDAFTYLLSAGFLYFLWGYKQGYLSFRALCFLPFLQLLWVNLHIYFFLGTLLVGLFLFEALVALVIHPSSEMSTRSKQLAVIALLTVLASCVNPAGVSGALYPLFILQGYGFPVFENYSVSAVLRAGYHFLPLTYFLIIMGTLGLSWIYVFITHRSRVSYANLLLSVTVTAMAWFSIRNFGLFAVFAMPMTAANLQGFLARHKGKPFWTAGKTTGALAALTLVLFAINPIYFVGGGRGAFGIGLKEGNQAAGEFFRRENLRGPIFNNFDVGGYLTYHLYPQERVYVENRPEAYPATFFIDEYFPLLHREDLWLRRSHALGFNTIVFNHRDRSAASQQFIIRRVLDPDWAPVFFDENIIIFVKRFGPDHATAVKFELAKDKVLAKTD